MRGRGNEMAVFEGGGQQPFGDEACGVGDIGQYEGTYFIGYAADARIVPVTAVRRSTAENEFRFMGACLLFQHVIVYQAVFFPDTIKSCVVGFAGEIDGGAMCQMAAHGEVQAEDGISRLQDGQHNCGIRLGAGVRLHVGVGAVEHLFDAIDGQLFGFIYDFTAAIVAAAGIAFSIFVGQDAARCAHNVVGSEIFGGDEFDAIALAVELPADDVEY